MLLGAVLRPETGITPGLYHKEPVGFCSRYLGARSRSMIPERRWELFSSVWAEVDIVGKMRAQEGQKLSEIPLSL